MKMMIMMNTMLNMMFITMKHPLSMGMTIIMQTIIISLITGMMFKTFWFSYILFIMYIGGMMVLFIYMTSLMPNMLFKMSKKSMMIIMLIFIMMTMMMNTKLMMQNNDIYNYLNINMLLIKMYNKPVNMTIILLASYLLFTMITVFKITESKQGPLRMMN
uniref:NADH-ubiquinone oxidoreductase chain 6 n=1 Tax=Ramulus mikado TaxID=2823491 RepID=E2RUV4_9NEOP|nr:NADH dehydrogenase subunit 6 [Ramulus irregulariterdentatus]BAJ24488.1 NADH dehydrogenase subunit 6 [Ramulus irregulariterdentatus]